MNEEAAAVQPCRGCGQPFECGMHAPGPCWCSTEFPAAMPLPDAPAGCYCRQCLAALIAAAKAAAGKPT